MKTILAFVFSLFLITLTACSTTGTGTGENAGSPDQSTPAPVVTEGLGEESGIEGEGISTHAGLPASTTKIEDQTYYFDFDRSNIHDRDRASLNAQAQYLVQNPHAKVRLEGYTDPRGSREYNIGLGERRADAVADFLKLQGVSSRQLQMVSYGAERLASSGHTEFDYQLDRRVRLVYIQK